MKRKTLLLGRDRDRQAQSGRRKISQAALYKNKLRVIVVIHPLALPGQRTPPPPII